MSAPSHVTPRPVPALPPRSSTGHKGTFGTVAVIGGCARPVARMIGAPALAAVGALRAGAGRAMLVVPEPIVNAALVLAPSATGRGMPVTAAGEIVAHEAAAVVDEVAGAADALVIGPGLGSGEGVRAAVVRAVQNDVAPVIVDADGLNALAATPEFGREVRARAVLTPHPGEFRRLCEGLGLRSHLGLGGAGADRARRAGACEQLAQRLGCVVVLKGADTVVSSGLETWTHEFADSVLAAGGTGDVLAGIIGGIVAQFAERRPRDGVITAVEDVIAQVPGMPADVVARLRAVSGKESTAESSAACSLFDCARLGVIVHAEAARAWRAEHGGADGGMLAMELAACVPGVMARMRGAGRGH